MSNTTGVSRSRFWGVRLGNSIAGGFLSVIIATFATLFLMDMGHLTPTDQQDFTKLIGLAAWVCWLIYFVAPVFRPATWTAPLPALRDLLSMRLLGGCVILLLANLVTRSSLLAAGCGIDAVLAACTVVRIAAPVLAILAALVFLLIPRLPRLPVRRWVGLGVGLAAAAVLVPIGISLTGRLLTASSGEMATQFTFSDLFSENNAPPEDDTPFAKGRTAFAQGDYPTAIDYWLPLANSGDAAAQNEMANLYASGLGVPQDTTEAIKWLRRAADQGDAMAQTNLGDMYAQGIGVPKDQDEAMQLYRRAAEAGDAYGQVMMATAYASGSGVAQDDQAAAEWYRRAADQGDAYAQTRLAAILLVGQGVEPNAPQAFDYLEAAVQQGHEEALGILRQLGESGEVRAQTSLGYMYGNGSGVAKDETESLRWYKAAAEQGDVIAQNNLGVIYDGGLGVPRDAAEAAKWYRLAADGGLADAQNALGILYATGEGVPQDNLQAYLLFGAAAEGGSQAAVANRDRAELLLTPEQLAVADEQRRYVTPEPQGITPSEIESLERSIRQEQEQQNFQQQVSDLVRQVEEDSLRLQEIFEQGKTLQQQEDLHRLLMENNPFDEVTQCSDLPASEIDACSNPIPGKQ